MDLPDNYIIVKEVYSNGIVKIITVMLSAATIMCSACVVPTSAQSTMPEVDIVSPLYEIAEDPISNLRFDSSNAICTSYSNGNDVISITAEQTLEKYWGLWIWNEVDGAKWTSTVNSNMISVTNTKAKSGLSSGTYRLKSVFTLTDKDGSTETITVYSSEQSC